MGLSGSESARQSGAPHKQVRIRDNNFILNCFSFNESFCENEAYFLKTSAGRTNSKGRPGNVGCDTDADGLTGLGLGAVLKPPFEGHLGPVFARFARADYGGRPVAPASGLAGEGALPRRRRRGADGST